MTESSESLVRAEEQLIAEVRRSFASFFRWIDFLDDMIKKDIGPKFGVDVTLMGSAVEQKVRGLLYVTRPLKEPLGVPFEIEGASITLGHAKFERDNEAGEKTARYDLSTLDDVNRILGDVVQDFIG
ncbi:hypothetical protein [Methylosinus sp. Sm6]|uniref:hypothetical protein n=1 Tax=Methylosinus sp. Sm6 TaxID=2866948 RepID=UPI001C9976AA|nr:hypothetical protein [Methylosinus sp. Sm6]MBY6243461.1 hypothetical protein [Methylosinus sp. Sm6]